MPAVSELASSSDGTGRDWGRGGASLGGGAPLPLRPQSVCECLAVPLWQGRQQSVWFSRTIAGWLSIVAFASLCLGNWTPRLFSSQTLARGFLVSCCVSSIAAGENPPLAILAIFKARRISDYSSCTRPPCHAMVAQMSKTPKKSVAASTVRSGYYLNHIRLLSLL